ncbi:MutS-related protein [Desulfallas thermosapovorans]|uniref:MutS-like protein n=1 Tax=Desulfallas thermosapovorans DSM 6562 TaxID=1121431 RepID=A0A5S4ZWP8_9FIRM|nr:MutS family DNA mismatch repair protein [Desulfallas thermosapovorans]TYO97447.1 MutS-like protein [Desulfallas thermosapovorans DSM 6562]
MDESIYRVYQAKKKKVAAKLSVIKKQNELFVVLRPLVFLAAAGLSIAYSFWLANPLYLICIDLMVLIFIAMVVKHNRIKAEIKYLETQVAINDKGLRRLEGKWGEFADTGERFIDPEHRYASDLNIFGQGSLFQYINAATTMVGENRLAQLLTSPSSLEEIARRQQALQELSRRFDWRQHFQTTGMLLDKDKKAGDLEKLLGWAEEKPVFTNKYTLFLPVIPLVTLILALLGYFDFIPPYIWVFPFVLQILVVTLTEKTAHQTFIKTGNTVNELYRYSAQLVCIETENFNTPLLKSLKRKLIGGGEPPSRQVGQLFKIMDRISMRYSSLHPVINIGLLWDLQTVIRLEKWRESSGRSLRGWIEIIAEFEALSSLAGLVHDHPGWAMPEITGSKPALKATILGHPLIKDEIRVCNDVELAEPGTVLLITGSNMSGKSTLLRTVGINLVLAYAGAPVCAGRFSCSMMDVYSSIHINDNLEKNISTFYAELLRIKLIVDAAKTGKPMIFLIDEIFKGTNSRDRITGAKAVIKALHELGSVGLVSTHDLELARLENEIPLIRNYHFTDQITGRDITFDYRLKPGVSRSTNALALMKIIGIGI